MPVAIKTTQPVKIYHPEEFVDVVSERDEEFVKVLKTEAHGKGLLHRCILGQIIDSKGRRLLVRQSASRQDPGQFVLPVGGHIQAGESELNALKREAEEEVGFNGNFKAEYVGKMIYNRDILGRHENHYFILYKIFSDQKPKINHESDDFRYFSPKQLKKLMKIKPEMFGTPTHLVYQQLFPEFFI